MRKILIIFSVMIFIIANVGLSQDIINETGKDGKFIVRDNEQNEAMIIEDGNVGITGELSVEQMSEGSSSNPYVVWDPEDKKFKIVERIFSKVSPLSEPLETNSWHSIGYGGVDDEGNEISASVQGTAAAWNQFDTDYGYIKLGPANANNGHIYTDRPNFVFNKPLYNITGEFGGLSTADLIFKTGGATRLQFVNATGFVGIGTTSPDTKLHVYNGAGNFSGSQDGTTLLLETDYGWNYLGFNGNGYNGILFNDDGYGLEGGIIYDNTNDDLRFFSGGVDRMIILDNGHIGFGDTSPSNDFHINGGDTNTYVDIQNTTTGSGFNDGLEFTVSGNTAYIRNQEDADLHLGTNNSSDLTIEDGGEIGIQTTGPGAGLDVNTDVILGVSGTRFMEIREISGTTGTGYYTSVSNGLPDGWTGAKTRLLSLEIQNSSSSGNWFGQGTETDGTYGIGGILDNDGRTFWVYYPNSGSWHGRAWRAMIMRMP